MEWLEVAVHIPSEGIEIVSQILIDMGTGGVSIEDPALIDQYINAGVWDYWEFPDQVLNQTQPIVKAYFPLNEHTQQKLQILQEKLDHLDLNTPPQTFYRSVQEEDWATAWRVHYKPLRVGRHWLIKPTWEDVTPGENEIVLELDPGMAFGSGTHPTTTMCLELMEDCIQPQQIVYDIGTGTGILAIGAAKLGAKEVLAVDLDEVAVKVAKENVAHNNVTPRVQVMQGDLLSSVTEGADLIIANIIADVIINLAAHAYGKLNTGGYLITSGIISQRADEVKQVLEKQGFITIDVRRQGEWVAYRLQKQ